MTPAENEAMVRLRAICAWCDHAEQGDVGVRSAVEAVLALAVEARCYFRSNGGEPVYEDGSLEGRNVNGSERRSERQPGPLATHLVERRITR